MDLAVWLLIPMIPIFIYSIIGFHLSKKIDKLEEEIKKLKHKLQIY